MPQRRRSGRRRADERGAVALLMTLVLGIVMVSTAFIVDLGMQKVARADMQALADVVALDLARELDGRTVAQLGAVLDAAAAESLARNQDIVGDQAPDLSYEVGVMDDGVFQAMASGVPTAVSVVARTAVDFAFASVIGSDEESGDAQRDAAAESSSTACFKLGSFVASVRTGDSTVLGPLNDLLGVRLDLVSYRALADADVRLGQLAADPRIGSPEALLRGPIGYADLLTVVADVLARETGGNNELAVTALRRLASSSVAATIPPVTLANVLNVAPTDRAALQVALNVLDIVGSARLSDGQYFLEVPNLQAQVPGVGNQFTGAIHLISAAKMACGMPNTEGSVADNAQLSGDLAVDFINLPSLNLPGLGTVQTAKGTGNIGVHLGGGEGRLVAPPEVHCGSGPGDPSTFAVDVRTELASYSVTADLSVVGSVKVDALEDLGLGGLLSGLLGGLLGGNGKVDIEVNLRLTVATGDAPGSDLVTLSIPPNDVTPVQVGSSVHLDPASVVPTISDVKIGGKVVANLGLVRSLTSLIVAELRSDHNGFVNKTLTPLINHINERFIGPAARMIGLRIGGADVYAVGVRCGDPRLVG
ncbi:hypothetical protein [Nocardioides sp. SYSU DS0651]|uniref:hypothetical protein n=1 Tax=Nocardioides sp. SYSU DS0651 TaxID=3415955 RepID=UPI003F4C3E8F